MKIVLLNTIFVKVSRTKTIGMKMVFHQHFVGFLSWGCIFGGGSDAAS